MRPVTERAQTWMVSGETLRNVKWKTELESKRAEVNQYIACHIQKRFSKWWQLKVKKMHVFYRCNQSPYLTHIHCSSRMTPGLTQRLGGSGVNFWQMKTSPSPPEEQSSSKHTVRTAVHAGGIWQCPARRPHCYWPPLIQHQQMHSKCNEFVTSCPILALAVGHLLPAHKPHWRQVDTGDID